MTGRDAVGEGVEPGPVVAEGATARPNWRRRVIARLGLYWDSDGFTVRVNARALGWTGAALIAGFYVLAFVQTLRTYEHHTPFPAIDEQILYLTAARNFNNHGFLASGFLQDLSTSRDAAGHPYVYNHMPAGPEIMVACVTRILGERYRLLRLVCAAMFVAGLFCYFRFVRDLMRHHGVGGAGLAVVFLTPYTIMSLAGHPMYCALPLLAFFPLVALGEYYRSRKTAWLIAALATVLASSVFLAYQFVIMTMVAWVGLKVLRLIPFERRHLLAFVGVTVAGVAAHVVQNLLWLGPSLAFREIGLTVMNRVSGHPTAESLTEFYQSINIVHHGTHRVNVGGLWSAVGSALAIPGLTPLAALACLLVAFRLWRVARFDPASRELRVPWLQTTAAQVPALLLLRLAVWLVVTVSVPLLLFPAYSADYNLQGVGQFFVAIGAAAVVVAAWRRFRQLLAPQEGAGAASAQLLLLLEVALLGTAAAAGVSDIYQKQAKSVGVTLKQASADTFATLPKLSAFVGGRVVMTNIYPAVVGFFTRETVLGGAEFECFPPDGPPQPDRAWAKHVRGYGPHVRPTHYVLFRSIFTGFTRHRDAESLALLRARVAARHKIVYEDELYTVFELEY